MELDLNSDVAQLLVRGLQFQQSSNSYLLICLKPVLS